MSLADLIATEKARITGMWLERLRGANASPSLPKPEIVDSLPAFLDEVAVALKQGRALEASVVATDHGEERLRLGFDVAAVIREYEVLRECIFDLARDERHSYSPEEAALLQKSLFVGAERAAAEYVRRRDEAARRQHAERLGFIAHEIRNPLGSASMALTILEKKRDLPRDEKTFGILTRAIAQLRRVVDQALAHVKLDTLEKLTVHRIGLRQFVTDIANDLALDAGARNQGIALHTDEAFFVADPVVLRSALTNLLTNAMKFSPDGATIELRAAAGEGRITIEVQDQCGGLPRRELEELFAPFVQASANRSGAGLGLAITKQAAEAHGGVVRVHDLPGKGCVFALSVPAEPPLRGQWRTD